MVEQARDRAVFRLTDSAETRAAIRSRSRWTIAFAIDGATLSIDGDGRQSGAMRRLPASFGFHPAFAWPLPYGRPRADHRIVVRRRRAGALRRLDADGLIAPDDRASPLDGRTLHLRDELFADDALIWDRVASQGVTYGAADGPQLRVDFPDTPMLGIWTKPGAASSASSRGTALPTRKASPANCATSRGCSRLRAGREKRIDDEGDARPT